MNSIDLSNRVAIVTGGAQGIGLAVTQRLLQSGAKVAIWDRDQSTLEQTTDSLSEAGTVHAEVVDVTAPDQIDKALEATQKALGAVDIAVLNAGIAGPTVPSWEYPLEEWRKVIDIDLNGVYYCCRALMPGMLERNYGRVVNIASIAGKEGNPNATAYSAAKAGVIALTKSIAKETASHDIAINCVTPAAARTRIFDQISQTHIDYMLVWARWHSNRGRQTERLQLARPRPAGAVQRHEA